MKKRLQRWFASEKTETDLPAAEQAPSTVEVESAMQALRMELEAREERITRLTQELERMRERQDALVVETVAARLESLIGELAAPASQVRTQAYLAQEQNKPVQAQDVLAVARRMIRALERHGLEFEGEIGALVSYDPNRHTPINTGAAPRSGGRVTVRFSGVRYGGKMIYKAIVE